MSYLETVTGRMVNVTDPDPSQIDIEDIAWGLSRIPRFAGQTISKKPYTVAQHSVLVFEIYSKIVKNNDEQYNNSQSKLKALMHDAAEAYIGDIPSPIKKHPTIKEAIKEFEYNLLNVIFDSCNIDSPDGVEKILIKEADMIALAIEAHAFMKSRGLSIEWGVPKISLLDLQNFEEPWDSITAYHKFKEIYNMLQSIGDKK